MIRHNENVFILETKHTTYCFRILETGHPEHLYYGRKLHVNAEALSEKHAFPAGNSVSYDSEHPAFCPEDHCFEISGLGKGDVREPFIELIHHDGGRTTDFRFHKYEITKTKPEFETLPGSVQGTSKVEHLTCVFREAQYDTQLEIHYYVYPECDVISRSARLINTGKQPVTAVRLMSMQLDLDRTDLVLTTFHGGWIREMQRTRQKLRAGTYADGSITGTSSSRTNPFFMLSGENTTEEAGSCYGFNLIYSGNHIEEVQTTMTGKTRVLSGIHPTGFSFTLSEGETLEAPEAVMTFSHEGFGALSRNMHSFVREHILRGVWKDKERPVLLNSWEASYFNVNEKNLLRLAKTAKKVGIELFVLDDGWFEGRNDDTTSLGDWRPDPKKLPQGLKGLADQIRKLGMDFGIWVEPEMISVNSRLYKEHPEWAMDIPGNPHSEGRTQRMLDLANPEVQEYVCDAMTEVFSSADISYVKWDMNRIVSDCYSKYLPADRQGETAHRYVCGLYRCMKTLTERFPDILFEGCASGGNRFDLGILCYFPQIWASDNSDAFSRLEIQNNYSYGYPMNVVTAHVSDSPNHQTLRRTPLHTRYNVASFGVLGYETNLSDLRGDELEAVRQQVEMYKKWRAVMQSGTFYRVRDLETDGCMQWCVVSRDKSKAVGMAMQGTVKPHPDSLRFFARGLYPSVPYKFYNIPHRVDIRDFGSLINTASPVHIRPGSLKQSAAASLIKWTSEKEEYEIYGDTLMYGGVALKQPFRAGGYNEEVRFWKDFESRLYYMEAEC